MLVPLAGVAACDGDAVDVEDAPDTGSSSGTVDRGSCPTGAPREGEACQKPEGTSCAFDACGISVARCTRGAWRFAENPAPSPSCPDAAPAANTSCPACWRPGATCPYLPLSCVGPDATGEGNIALASCVGGKWEVDFTPCTDAGADVQGDGDADAD